MDFIEVINSRRVQRAYANKPVELEKLRAIVDAGRHAMSARNLQPWNFIVIRDRATIKQLAELCSTGKFVAEAPAAIAVLKDAGNARWADVDCGQAVMNMANAAWSMGLGTCWVGNFEGDKIATLLGVPQGWATFTVLPFGYQDEKNPPQAKPLKPRGEVVHFERFGKHQD
ncbi:MAG TPA: nitroreductase family protein [Candidatus Binataceae bacterium]|nr:nitroreductase family protein [Candidatus Binataceae bacterium]